MAGRDLSAELFSESSPKGGRDLSADLFAPKTDNTGTAGNVLAGAVKGASDIGNTLLSAGQQMMDPTLWAMKKLGIKLPEDNTLNHEQRKKAIQEVMAQYSDPESLAFKGGALGAQVAGTAGAGGALANVARSIPGLSSAAPGLASAIESGGFSVKGAPAASTAIQAAKNIATRLGGGAITGAASAGLVDPSSAGEGAAIGAAMPIVGKVAGELGRFGKAAVLDPLFNQNQIIGGTLARTIGHNNLPSVLSGLATSAATPGVRFSAGQSTGNAGLNALEDTFRSINPSGVLNAQDQANRGVLSGTLRDIAKDDMARSAAEKARRDAAGVLYGDALDQSNMQEVTPWIKGQVTQLLKRPSINDASRQAQRFAMERGEKPAKEGSLAALHDVKTALDDMISKAKIDGQGGQVKALSDTQAQLLNVMEKLSPTYQDARTTYAQMSRPINQMDVGTLLANKLIPSTAGDVPASLNAASLARALQNPESIALKATGNRMSDLSRVMEPDQMTAINGVNRDASRIAEAAKLGAGYGSPTARRQSIQGFVGDNMSNEYPMLKAIIGGLGNVPGIKYAVQGADLMGGLLGKPINSHMATKLEESLAADPAQVKAMIIAAQDAAAKKTSKAGLLNDTPVKKLIRAGLLAIPGTLAARQ